MTRIELGSDVTKVRAALLLGAKVTVADPSGCLETDDGVSFFGSATVLRVAARNKIVCEDREGVFKVDFASSLSFTATF